MSIEIPQDVAEKLAKILVLAGNEGATEGEVLAAMGRARAMLQKFNLSLDDFQTSQASKSAIQEDIIEESVFETPQLSTWVSSLLTGVATLTNTKFFYSMKTYDRITGQQTTKYFFVGQKTDIGMAAALANYLYIAAKGFADIYTNAHAKNRDNGGKRKYRNSFYFGFTEQVQKYANSLRSDEQNNATKERAELVNNGDYEVPPHAIAIRWNAVILRKENAIEKFVENRRTELKLKKASSKQTSLDADGFNQGRETADTLLKKKPRGLVE